MVDEAMKKTREGNIVTRTVRNLTGGEVHADIPVEVTYSRKAVNALVRRIKRKIDQPARDASVSFGGGSIAPVAGRNGRSLDARTLGEDIAAALVEPASNRVIKARVRTTKPEVTTAELAQKYPKIITVNRATKQLTLYIHLKPSKTYGIAVGAAGYDTPAGQYAIQTKQVNPYWHVPQREWAGELAGRIIPPGPQNPLKARWMGIYNGAGIHGTAESGSIGTAASHGCIRMHVPDVIDLFERVEVGTTVFIS
jgi:lipoprotein-anchoring transpeptidase ErfK/SrfK